MNVELNATYEVKKLVEKENLAVNVTSGDVEVFATPMLVVMFENAANLCLKQFLDETDISVGTQISCTHSAPTGLGNTVTAKVKIVEVDGRKVVFALEAYDNDKKISEGTHERFILNKEKFMSKVN